MRLKSTSWMRTAEIPDTPGVHGVAIASVFKHGFSSNGRENKVSPCSIRQQRVFTNNHGSHNISAIDAATGEATGTVKADGDGEQGIIGVDGLIYVNSENTAEVVVFDPKSLEVKKRFPIGVAKTPTGLAYDAKPTAYSSAAATSRRWSLWMLRQAR